MEKINQSIKNQTGIILVVWILLDFDVKDSLVASISLILGISCSTAACCTHPLDMMKVRRGGTSTLVPDRKDQQEKNDQGVLAGSPANSQF
jgi:hypothetical protein